MAIIRKLGKTAFLLALAVQAGILALLVWPFPIPVVYTGTMVAGGIFAGLGIIGVILMIIPSRSRISSRR